MKNRLLALSLVFSAFPIFAWQEYDTFYEELDVILYQLQVNVLDKQGNPIKGLKKGDFQVKVDGKVQEIEAIEEISLNEIVVEGDLYQASALPEQAKRIFVLFFDLRYSNKGGIIAARNAAVDFVETEMLPSDLIGVFVYNPLSGISMVTNFTSDQNHLLNALDTLGLSEMQNTVQGPSGYFLNGLLSDFQTRLLDSQRRNSQNQRGGNRPNPQALALDTLLEMSEKAGLAEKRNYETEVQNFLGSFKAFADGLKYIRGRKNIMWFSSGFDSSGLVGVNLDQLSQNAERALYGDIDRVSSDQLGRGDIQNLAKQTVKTLQGSGSVIFAIDTSRLGGSTNAKSGLQTLNYFSVDTGGRTYTNRNDLLPVMSEIQDITNHYYLVSFYPNAKKKPGKVQSLKVKVNKSGAKIFSSRGVLLENDFRKMSDLEKQIQLAEFVGRNQIAKAVPLSFGTIQVPMNHQLSKLSITIDIAGNYFFETQHKNKAKKLEVFTYAFTKDTNEIFDQTDFRFKIDPKKVKDVLSDTGVKYVTDLFLAPGEYRLKVITRDRDTGKIGSAIKDIKIEPLDHQLCGPTLLDGSKWVMLREPESTQAQKKLGDLDFSYAYRFNGRDLVPASKMEVSANQKASFFYALNVRMAEPPKTGALLMGPGDQPIQIPASAMQVDYDIPKTGTNAGKVLLTLDLSKMNLKPGTAYKMMSQFQIPSKEPIRAITDFTVSK